MSVVKLPVGPAWPLGFVSVANTGVPVCIMHNVDANNNNAPGVNQGNPGNATGSEYTVTCKQIAFYGAATAGNNGTTASTGKVYVSWNPTGNNNQNKADAGAFVGIIPANGNLLFPSTLSDPNVRFSPYAYTIDAEVNGEGAVVVLIDPRGQ